MGKYTAPREDYSTSSSTTDDGGLQEYLLRPEQTLNTSDEIHDNRKSFQSYSIPLEGTLEVRMLQKKQFARTNFFLRKYYSRQVKRAAKEKNQQDQQQQQDKNNADMMATLEQIPQMQEKIRELSIHNSRTNKKGSSRGCIRQGLPLFRFLWSSYKKRNEANSKKHENPKGIGGTEQQMPGMDVWTKIAYVIEYLKDKKDLTFSDPLTAFKEQIFMAKAAPSNSTDGQEHVLDCLIQSSIELMNLTLERSAIFLAEVQNHEQEVALLPQRAHYRALTNFWVYSLFEWIISPSRNMSIDETFVCPGAYAYSFLYPYTDDILDDEQTDKSHKKVLVSNIFKMIEHAAGKGKDEDKVLVIPPEEFAFCSLLGQNPPHFMVQKEKRVYDLLGMLLEVNNSDCLLASLHNVNAAQMQSMKQKRFGHGNLFQCVKQMSKQEKDEIFDITVRKGIAACLPNAYLLYPDGLTADEAEIISILGGMGQHLNDIEGIFDDLKEKSLTPALISFLKHDCCLDRFFERASTYMRTIAKTAPKRLASLPLDRVIGSLSLLQMQVVATTALLHCERSPGGMGVLSEECLQSLDYWLCVDLPYMARFARAEQEICGGVPEEFATRFQRHQLSSPQQFLSFLEHMLNEKTDTSSKETTTASKTKTRVSSHGVRPNDRGSMIAAF